MYHVIENNNIYGTTEFDLESLQDDSRTREARLTDAELFALDAGYPVRINVDSEISIEIAKL